VLRPHRLPQVVQEGGHHRVRPGQDLQVKAGAANAAARAMSFFRSMSGPFQSGPKPGRRFISGS